MPFPLATFIPRISKTSIEAPSHLIETPSKAIEPSFVAEDAISSIELLCCCTNDLQILTLI